MAIKILIRIGGLIKLKLAINFQIIIKIFFGLYVDVTEMN